MNLDEVLVNDLLFHEELLNLFTVVALELNNLTVLVVGHDGAITAKILGLREGSKLSGLSKRKKKKKRKKERKKGKDRERTFLKCLRSFSILTRSK